MKTVFRAFSSAEAQLARSRLEAAGLQVFLADEGSAMAIEGYVLGAGGLRLQVPEPLEQEARNLLKSYGYPLS